MAVTKTILSDDAKRRAFRVTADGRLIVTAGGGGGGGGAAVGAWDPAAVAMHTGTFGFSAVNTRVTNSTTAAGSIKNTTARSGKREVQIRVKSYGTFAVFSPTVGLIPASATMVKGWHTAGQDNCTWTPDGTRYTNGQTASDTSGLSQVAYGSVQGANDVLCLRYDSGVGTVECALITGGVQSPWRTFPAFVGKGPCYVRGDVGYGNFDDAGDNIDLEILTNASTFALPVSAGFTPWDD